MRLKYPCLTYSGACELNKTRDNSRGFMSASGRAARSGCETHHYSVMTRTTPNDFFHNTPFKKSTHFFNGAITHRSDSRFVFLIRILHNNWFFLTHRRYCLWRNKEASTKERTHQKLSHIIDTIYFQYDQPARSQRRPQSTGQNGKWHRTDNPHFV